MICLGEMTGSYEVTTNCDRTSRLLDSYRLNIKTRGFSAVRDIIAADILRFTELGAGAYVADLRKALFRLEEEADNSTCSPPPCHPSTAAAYETVS